MDSTTLDPREGTSISNTDSSRASGTIAMAQPKSRSECEAYESLVRELEDREPTDEDFRRLAEHEASCASGRHSEAGVESDLGLPQGALRQGSPAHGLKPARELVDLLVEKHLKTERSLAQA